MSKSAFSICKEHSSKLHKDHPGYDIASERAIRDGYSDALFNLLFRAKLYLNDEDYEEITLLVFGEEISGVHFPEEKRLRIIPNREVTNV